jgi:hypothetical protein
MLFMIIERFRAGNPDAVGARFRSLGRLMPENAGLTYVASWMTTDGSACYQLMEAPSRQSLDGWIANWDDLVDFQVIPVQSGVLGRPPACLGPHRGRGIPAAVPVDYTAHSTRTIPQPPASTTTRFGLSRELTTPSSPRQHMPLVHHIETEAVSMRPDLLHASTALPLHCSPRPPPAFRRHASHGAAGGAQPADQSTNFPPTPSSSSPLPIPHSPFPNPTKIQTPPFTTPTRYRTLHP